MKQKLGKAAGSPACKDSVSERRAQYNDEDRAHRKGSDEIGELLAKEPWKILRTLMYVKGLQKGTGEAQQHSDEAQDNHIPWPATYTVHRKIPKYWIMLWFASLGGIWAGPLLEEIDKRDGNAIGKLLELGTGVALGRALVAALRQKIVLSRFYSHLETMLGNRLRKFPRSAIENGHISWDKVSVYIANFFTDDKGRACNLRHRYFDLETVVRLPPESKDFELLQATATRAARSTTTP